VRTIEHSKINVRPVRPAAVTEGPTGVPVPPRFDLQAALAPDTIRASIDRHFAETERPLRQLVDRTAAQRDLVRHDLTRRELQIRAGGGDPALDEGVTNFTRQVEQLDAEIATTSAQIAARRARAALMIEKAPALLAAYVEAATAALRAFAAGKEPYDLLTEKAKAVEDLLRDSDPTTGQPYLVGVRVPNGSVLSLFKVLEPIFGLDRNAYGGGGWLTRVLREAKELGIEVEVR
jgi:hypothetical protein